MNKPVPVSYDKKIKKIVYEIMNEKNDNPRDSTFRFLQHYHGEAQHISLRFPGEFVANLKIIQRLALLFFASSFLAVVHFDCLKLQKIIFNTRTCDHSEI